MDLVWIRECILVTWDLEDLVDLVDLVGLVDPWVLADLWVWVTMDLVE